MRSLPTVGKAVALLAALAGAGCATKIYQGPTSGRGAEQQLAVATSAERAFAGFDAVPFQKKRVLVEVYGLTDKLEGESPEEAFVRGLLVERLLKSGASVVARREDAEILLAVALRSAGVDVIRRDAPVFYHHTTFHGVTSARVTAYVLRNSLASQIFATQDLQGEAVYREIFIFYIFGPIEDRE